MQTLIMKFICTYCTTFWQQTCHNRESTAAIPLTMAPFSTVSQLWQWAKLKQLNGIQPLFFLLCTPVLFLPWYVKNVFCESGLLPVVFKTLSLLTTLTVLLGTWTRARGDFFSSPCWRKREASFVPDACTTVPWGVYVQLGCCSCLCAMETDWAASPFHNSCGLGLWKHFSSLCVRGHRPYAIIAYTLLYSKLCEHLN